MFARLLLDDMRLKSKCNRMCELHRLLYAHRDSSTVALYHELELHHFPFMIAALQCIACMYCLRVYRMPHRRSQIPIIAVAATAATAAAAIQNETFDGNMCEFEEEREKTNDLRGAVCNSVLWSPHTLREKPPSSLFKIDCQWCDRAIALS